MDLSITHGVTKWQLIVSIIAIKVPQTKIWRIDFFPCHNPGVRRPLLFIIMKSQIVILIQPFFDGSGGDEQLLINCTWPNADHTAS